MAVSLMGPIGHGWNAPEGVSSALLVAGGVGAAPLFLHAQELVASGIDVEVVMGAQSDKALVCEPKYSELLGHEPHLATDDGSRGHAGFVTDVVAGRIAEKQFDYVAWFRLCMKGKHRYRMPYASRERHTLEYQH